MYETNHFRTLSRNKYKIISVTCTLLTIKSITKVYFSMGRYLFDGITIDSLFLVTSIKNNNLANCNCSVSTFPLGNEKTSRKLICSFHCPRIIFQQI